MILIDTSAWVEFLRRGGRRDIKERVSLFLELDQAAITDPVRFELLSGVTRKTGHDLQAVFELCRHIPFTEEDWTLAATHERTLRSKGVTVPRDDLFIATVAIRNDLHLYHLDRHFDLMIHAGLKLKIST